MSNNFTRDIYIDNESFYDIEIRNSSENTSEFTIDPNLLRETNVNNQPNCNKTIILNRIVYFLLFSSISFIIYDHYKIIGFYLSNIV